MVDATRAATEEVSVGIVGKYVDLADSYKSLNEALIHGGLANGVKTNLVFIDSETLEGSGYPGELFEVDAILVPGEEPTFSELIRISGSMAVPTIGSDIAEVRFVGNVPTGPL